MRVGIDANGVIAATGRTGSYLLELLPDLLRQADGDDEVLLFSFPDSDSDSLGWLLRDSHLKEVEPPFRGKHSGGLWRKLSFPAVETLTGASGTSNLDACHSLQPPMLPSRSERRILSLLDLPDGTLSGTLRRSIVAADYLVTPSRQIANEVVDGMANSQPDRAGETEDKLRIVPPGAHERFFDVPKGGLVADLMDRYSFLEDPYLLSCSGSFVDPASLPLLLEGWTRARQVDPTVPALVYLANSESSKQLVQLVSELGADQEVLIVEGLETDLLPALYRGAEFILYPAHDGAFGRIVLEAAAAGITSVVGRRCGALETLGAGLVRVDESDPERWAHAIVELHGDSSSRNQRAELCRTRSRSLTWAEAARSHWEIYRGQV